MVMEDHITEYTPGDPIDRPKVAGGGGTAMAPVFEWIKKNDIRPEAVVYLTDGYASRFGPKPPYPVLWVTTGTDAYIPWGEITSIHT
jgi:predicted metal-dependent peptidase